MEIVYALFMVARHFNLGRFSFKASIVARPAGVNPTIFIKDSSQIKWSVHFCFRGLKSLTSVLSKASIPVNLLYLWLLQPVDNLMLN